MRINLRKLSFGSIALYFIMFLVVLSTNSVLHAKYFMEVLLAETFVLFLCAFVMAMYVSQKTVIQTDTINVFFIAIYYLMAVLYTGLRMNGSNLCIFILLFIIPIEYIIINYVKSINKFQQMMKALYYVIMTIAVIALFFWIFGSVLHWIQPTGETEFVWGIKRKVPDYYKIYFEAQNFELKIGGIDFSRRNCAMFVEAPMSNYIFCVGLILAEFYVQNVKFRSKVILIIAILSTLTTTGFTFLTIYLIYKVLRIKKNGRFLTIIKIVLFIFGAVFAFYMVSGLIEAKLDTGSGIVRSRKIAEEMSAFRNNILIGNGFNTHTNGSSNAFSAVLADGGLLLGTLYWFPMVCCLIYSIFKKNVDYSKILYMMLMLMVACQYTTINGIFCVIAWQEFFGYIRKAGHSKKYDNSNTSYI